MSTAQTPETPGTPRGFSTEQYFQTQQPPAGLEVKTSLVEEFVAKWRPLGKRVVLVTVGQRFNDESDVQSGGTTVPLEANTYIMTLDTH